MNTRILAFSGAMVFLLAAVVLMMLAGCAEKPCTCPEVETVVTAYLFRDAWGDCPAGCATSIYWYFECSPEGCEFIGYWDHLVDPEPPAWWERASASRDCFWSGGEFPGYSWGRSSAVTTTPRENREAEEAALWLSGSLVAPDTLYWTILADLTAIRGAYGDVFPRLRTLSFHSAWVPSRLSVYLSDEAMEQFLRGEYRDLDSLNNRFKVTSVEHRYSQWLWLKFAGRLNPNRLAEIYRAVPSVEMTSADGFFGDFPNVYPWLVSRPE